MNSSMTNNNHQIQQPQQPQMNPDVEMAIEKSDGTQTEDEEEEEDVEHPAQEFDGAPPASSYIKLGNHSENDYDSPDD